MKYRFVDSRTSLCRLVSSNRNNQIPFFISYRKLVPRLGFSPMILAHPREIVLSSSVEVGDTEDDKSLQRFLILL